MHLYNWKGKSTCEMPIFGTSLGSLFLRLDHTDLKCYVFYPNVSVNSWILCSTCASCSCSGVIHFCKGKGLSWIGFGVATDLGSEKGAGPRGNPLVRDSGSGSSIMTVGEGVRHPGPSALRGSLLREFKPYLIYLSEFKLIKTKKMS